jgi:hypothetical protein
VATLLGWKGLAGETLKLICPLSEGNAHFIESKVN